MTISSERNELPFTIFGFFDWLEEKVNGPYRTRLELKSLRIEHARLEERFQNLLKNISHLGIGPLVSEIAETKQEAELLLGAPFDPTTNPYHQQLSEYINQMGRGGE